MSNLIHSPLFGPTLCLLAYWLGQTLHRRFQKMWTQPLLVASAMVILVLQLMGVSYDTFNDSAQLISAFLGPVTAVLGLSIYRQRHILKRHLLPILAGCAAGAFTALTSVFLMSRLFGLNALIQGSILPKSVTTPIAIELALMFGGEPSITMVMTLFTGILGAVLSPWLVVLFRLKNPTTIGIAIGSSSHVIGTSKALEMGETQGAMAGLAIGIMGLFTVFFSLLFLYLV